MRARHVPFLTCAPKKYLFCRVLARECFVLAPCGAVASNRRFN